MHEWTLRYKVRPGGYERPLGEQWETVEPAPKSWDDVGELVKILGKAKDPVLFVVICIDPDV